MFFKKKIMPWEFDNKNLKKSVEKKTKVQLMLEFLDPNASLKILEIGTANIGNRDSIRRNYNTNS